MSEAMKLWDEFKKSGAPGDYLRYRKAREAEAEAGRRKALPAADSVGGITELP